MKKYIEFIVSQINKVTNKAEKFYSVKILIKVHV